LRSEPAPVKTVPRPNLAAPPVGPTLVSVVAEPVHEAPRTGLLARLHLTSRHKDRTDFVPPEPVHHLALAIPPDLRARARLESPIDVRVYVDRTGRVEYAELESEATATDRDLAALAVFSSRRWQFVPAHIGDRKVPGEVVLRYRFGTP
jgi:outer membrane biosynthesis protein TonB